MRKLKYVKLFESFQVNEGIFDIFKSKERIESEKAEKSSQGQGQGQTQGQGVEESKIYESDDRLHRIISKYYKNFLTNFFDDNDPDRDGINIDQQKLSDDFINDCIELFGENGSDEYNSGFNDIEVKNIANQVIDEDK